ncbi:RNA methyltransferase [Rhizobium sp. YJ-22]|uniref:TrmH family RNA methyltransferase n=1 Tax=Rhizobium sp. YJ-22 TaxID=3037556 RepID=UPI0024126B18|nr:RNA methyltransferase [Rhizobium sp. YJ-22]MDG3576289.1 RNA methyltransferase [Rhizobium sp. YJ-22]
MRETIRIEEAGDPRIAAFRDIRERDLTGRQDRFIAEGTVVLRVLAEAHAHVRFAVEAVLLLSNRVDGVRDILARLPDGVPVYVADQAVMNGIVGFDMHRGVLALGRRVEKAGAEAVIAGLPQAALAVVCCGISNHDNIGAIFRNAAALGADAVLLDETCCDPLYRKALRVSVGAVLAVPYSRAGRAEDILATLAATGFGIMALSPSGMIDIRAAKPGARTALVLGTEGEGLPAEILARFDSVRVPQAPGLDSLNVGTATGIALYQIASAMGRI